MTQLSDGIPYDAQARSDRRDPMNELVNIITASRDEWKAKAESAMSWLHAMSDSRDELVLENRRLRAAVAKAAQTIERYGMRPVSVLDSLHGEGVMVRTLGRGGAQIDSHHPILDERGDVEC